MNIFTNYIHDHSNFTSTTPTPVWWWVQGITLIQYYSTLLFIHFIIQISGISFLLVVSVSNSCLILWFCLCNVLIHRLNTTYCWDEASGIFISASPMFCIYIICLDCSWNVFSCLNKYFCICICICICIRHLSLPKLSNDGINTLYQGWMAHTQLEAYSHI